MSERTEAEMLTRAEDLKCRRCGGTGVIAIPTLDQPNLTWKCPQCKPPSLADMYARAAAEFGMTVAEFRRHYYLEVQARPTTTT